MIRLIPGDIVDLLVESAPDPVVEARIRSALGLDKSIVDQWWAWLGGLLRGDLGTSLRSGRPALLEVLDRFPATVELTLGGLLVSALVGIPSGVLSATHRNGKLDVVTRIGSLIGLSLPNFWLGILLVMFLAVFVRVLPSSGYTPWAEDPVDHVKHLVLPVITLGVALAAVTARMTRSAVLEVLSHDYIRTARAKGLGEASVQYRHALQNAFIPVVTVLGIQEGNLLGGSVVVETVFSWPGVGSVLIRAINMRDYPVVQASVMLLALFFVLANLVVDLLYVYLDPRLRRA
jgi:peptide/nickel transport system permease protein